MEPFGTQRDNWHMAVLASLFAAAHTGKGKRRPTVKDFMYTDATRKNQDQTKTFLQSLMRRARGKDDAVH